jgi:flagellar motility protein MotE (MotC chaperone)
VVKENSYSKTEWILYIIILPFIFTIILTFFILQFIGYNIADKVTGYFKQIPVVKNAVSSTKDASSGTQKDSSEVRQLEKQMNELNLQVSELQKLRDSLLKSQEQKDALISQLRNQIFTLQKQLDDKKAEEDKQKADAALYEDMSPGKAAAILEAMPNEQARNILNHLSTDAKAAILEKMDPKKVPQLVSQ